LLALVNSGRVMLLDDALVLGQLRALERRTRSGGRDSVGHRPGGHDDVAAAAAGALVLAAHGADEAPLALVGGDAWNTWWSGRPSTADAHGDDPTEPGWLARVLLDWSRSGRTR
jgi:hypothetical protein